MSMTHWIRIGVDPSAAREGAKVVEGSLRGIKEEARRTQGPLAQLDGGFGAMKSAVMGLATSWAALKVGTTISQFEQLRARLETVTGSTQAAANAFDLVTRLASKTPYSVQTLTDVFARLEAQGITPTEKRLTSFGNAAAAMGKDITQFAEAVLDAQTGEFERLKEFGIKASSEGDRVRFTFKGVSTEVGKNAAEIVRYIEGLSDANFAGAMEKQAKTLAGAWSNLGDAASQFVDRLGQSGLSEVLGNMLREVTGWITTVVEEWDALTAAMWSMMAGAVENIGGMVTRILKNLAENALLLYRGISKLSFLPGGEKAKTEAAGVVDLFGSMWESSQKFTTDLTEDLRTLSDDAMARYAEGLRGGEDATDKLGAATGELTTAAKKAKEAYADLGAEHARSVADLQAQIAAVGQSAEAEREAAIAIEARARAAKLGSGATKAMVAEITRQVTEEHNLKSALEDANAALENRKVLVEALFDLNQTRDRTATIMSGGLDELAAQTEEEEAFRRALEMTGGVLNERTAMWHEIFVAQGKATKELESQKKLEEGIRQTAGKILDPEAQRAEFAKQRADALEDEQNALEAWERNALGVAAVFDQIGQAMGRFNGNLGQAISGTAQLAANLITAYKAWKAQGSQTGYSAEGMAQGAGIGSQIGGWGQQAGFWQGDRGQSNFGGGMSGDYGDTGAMIGGIVGSFFGPIGSAVVGLIGGVLGGLIKNGADEGLGQLQKTLTGVAMQVTKSEGGLGKHLAQIGEAINAALIGLMEQLGGTLVSIPGVSFKIRDNTITVWVGEITKQFDDLQKATEFAIMEILRQGEISGLGENVRKVLQGSVGKSLEQLGQDLDFAQYMDNLGLDEVALRIREELKGFRLAMQKAAELGLDTNSLVAQFGKNLGAIRDQILGISESEEDRIKRQAEAFNTEVALLRAEQQMKVVDLRLQEAGLQAQLAVLTAEQHLTEAELELGRARVNAHVRMLEADSGILAAEGEILNGKFSLLEATLYQLSVVQGAIAAAEQMLGNLPDLISPEDIAAAIGRGNSGSSGVGSSNFGDLGESLEDVRGELDSIARGLLPELARQVAEINVRYEELLERARRVGIAEEEIFALRERELARLRQDTEATLLGYIADAGTDEMLNPISLALDEIERWRQSLIDSADELGLNIDLINAAADARKKLLADETRGRVADFADPYGIGGAAKLAADAAKLRQEIRNLGLDAEETARLLADVDIGETLRREMAVNDILGQLYQYLEASPEYAEQIAAFKRMEFDLQMEIIRQQLIAYGVWEQYAETWAAAAAAGAAALEDAANQVGQSGYGGGGGGGGTYEDMVADLRRRLAQYLNLGVPDGFARELAELTTTFQELYAEAGRLGVPISEVTAAFEAARRDLMNRVVEPILQLQRDLFGGGSLSLDSPAQRLASLQSQAAAEFQAAMGGDLDAYQRFADLARQLMDSATGAYGGGVGSAYYRDMIAAWLQQLQAAGLALGASPTVNPSDPFLPPGATVRGGGERTSFASDLSSAVSPVVAATDRAGNRAHEDAREMQRVLAGLHGQVAGIRAEGRMARLRPQAVN